MPPAPQKKRRTSRSSLRAQPRWVQYQDPRQCGCPGQPITLELTGGQRHDITKAEPLIADYEFEHLIADKSYDADPFLEILIQRGAVPVIPPRANRKQLRDYDDHLYRERHLVECFFNKIKHYRRIFSRFEKLAGRYLGFLSFVGALIWLR